MIPRRRAHASPEDLLLLLRDRCGDAAWDDRTIRELERELANQLQVPHAVAMGSGRQAMELILRGLGVSEGHEVIVPAWTLGALVPLIEAMGAQVVPADVDPFGFGIDPNAVAARMSPRTRVVLALHPFGVPCAIQRLAELCRERGALLIEDCAHALGASVDGVPVGGIGHAGFFSFEVTKPLNTYGGGLLVTANGDLADLARARRGQTHRAHAALRQKMVSAWTERLMFSSGASLPMLYLLASARLAPHAERLYRRFQRVPDPDQAYLPLQAELGLRRLPGLHGRTQARARLVQAFAAAVEPGIHIQKAPAGSQSSWYFLVARLPVPASPVRRRLLAAGIDAGVGAEIADDVATALGYHDCPVVAELHRCAIVLPLYDGIPERAVHRVARVLNKAVAERRGGAH